MNMASLVDALHSIVRESGRPDVVERRKELEKLMAVLLPSEIRLLQRRLDDIKFVRDFIPDLPVEICISITSFLDLGDLISVRKVSKRWYSCWTHVSICNKLMKEYFRSAFENTYMHLSDREKRSTFMAASDRLLSMQSGQYHTMSILRYDAMSEDSNESVPVLDRRYCNGRVAWPIEGGIKVTNLRTGTIATYMMPDRDKIQLWVLAESFLVAGTADKAKLYAWQLDGNIMHTVRLPSLPTNRISLHGERVGIVTSNYEAMIWQVGGTLHQMNITNFIPNPKDFRDMAIIFHPDLVDVVFAVFLNCQKVDEDAEVTGNVQWRVQKYLHSQLAATYKLEYPLEGLDYRSGDEPAEIFWLGPRKIDDNGSYSIGSVPVDFASRFLDLGCNHHWDRWYRRRGHRHLALHITFNVYEERLSTCYYHLPGGHKDTDYINFITPQIGDRPLVENSHLWNGQIFLPVIKLLDPVALIDPRYKLPVKRLLLMAIKSCDQISGPPTDVQHIGGYGPDLTVWKTMGRFANRDLGLIYCWVGDPHLAEQNPLSTLNTAMPEQNQTDREIRGDGTFVVLFGEYDFVVWCYDKRTQVELEE